MENPITISSVLFVCTANQIRSPMGGALFLEKLKSKDPNWHQWRVETAGTWAVNNRPPLPHAQEVMKRRGLSISQHRSRRLTKDLLKKFNLILVMELGQKEALQVEFPQAANHVFILSEMGGHLIEIVDPVGGNLEDYSNAAEDIEYWLDVGMQNIIRLAKARI